MNIRSIRYVALIALAPVLLSARAGPPVWQDSFGIEDLDPAWFWLNEKPEAWSLTENPGYLRIRAASLPTGEENLLLRPGAEGNFAIETHVLFEPYSNFQFAGLVIFQDQANFLQLGRAYCDVEDTCIGNGIYFDNIRNGDLAGGNFATTTKAMSDGFLRIELKGRKITAFYSEDGESWQEIGRHEVPSSFRANAVGLSSSQDYDDTDEPIAADFDYFSLTGKPKPSSPFVGEWQAVDGDGGDMRLAIGGPPNGPFNITWTEGYFGYCGGGAGIARGKGWLSPDDPYFLEGELLLECFNSEIQPLEMRPGWQYDPSADTLTAHGGEGETDTVWHRPGHPPAPPSWIVIARPADDGVDGGHFPEGTVVSLLVLDDEHNARWRGAVTAGYPEWDPEHAWVQYDLGADDVDLIAGDHVWLYDGTNAKELVVTSLEVTAVDLGSYTVSGSAEPGSEVFVDVPGGTIIVAADQQGYWEAPFDGSALGQWWAAYQLDSDEDQTRVGFFVPSPRFSVFPEWEYIEGWDWPEEATVNVTVEGKSDCNASGTSGHPDWEPQALFVGINLPDGCDVEPEDLVVLTDGVTTRTHMVRYLAITEVDELADTVVGTAAAGTEVHVWPHGFDEVLSTADGGIWSAVVSTDLLGGMCGRSDIRDDYGNATAVDWCARRFSVFPEWEYIEGWDWPEGATVTVSVVGKPECDASGTSGHPDWDPRAVFVAIELPDGCDVVTGDQVALSDDGTPRTHTIRNLGINVVDPLADTVTGTADPGTEVHVWPHGYGEVLSTANDAGIWTAAFSVDLLEGMCGRSEIRDGDGNATAVDWCVAAGPRVMVGNFDVEWSPANPEEIVSLQWKGSPNLTNPWKHPNCSGDLHFFGNSWVSENEDTPDFFFASLVGWGSTGTWTVQSSTEIGIGSLSSGCPGSANIPVSTQYQFFDDEPKANVIEVRRTYGFGATAYAHDVRPFIPRLFPADGFSQVLHPSEDGDFLATETTCGFGCMITDWDGTWFAIHDPTTGVGMIVLHEPSGFPVALWVDDDGGSFTNASSVLLLHPGGGFTGMVEETELLCFYNGADWTPSLTLPPGCEP
jgi:hypothetical protein